MAARTYAQDCGLVAALELVGERWALLIVRELLGGARRYSDLQAALERIPTNILSDRLRELQAGGVLRRVPRVRGGYELTGFGHRLEPVLLGLAHWGLGVPTDGAVARDAGRLSADAVGLELRAAFDADAARALPASSLLLRVGDTAVVVIVDAVADAPTVLAATGALTAAEDARRSAASQAAAGDLVLEAGLRRGLCRDGIRVQRGDPALRDWFMTVFCTPADRAD